MTPYGLDVVHDTESDPCGIEPTARFHCRAPFELGLDGSLDLGAVLVALRVGRIPLDVEIGSAEDVAPWPGSPSRARLDRE